MALPDQKINDLVLAGDRHALLKRRPPSHASPGRTEPADNEKEKSIIMRYKGSETILVVDDDPMILSFIEEGIGLYGYKPIVATSGEEALKLAENERVDILVTDIMMPGMNGIDLAKKFAVSNPEVKILFMSGYVCPSLAHQGVPESEYAFVQKPFAPKTLVRKIRNVLSGPNGLKELEDSQPG